MAILLGSEVLIVKSTGNVRLLLATEWEYGNPAYQAYLMQALVDH